MVDIGDKLPPFSMPADDGSTITPASLAGRPAVLYFYPKDDTSGCTLEAQEFTALAAGFAARATPVIGISPDSVKSHCKFRDKYGLAVRLAADEGSKVCTAFGVWGEKKMYGKTYMGVERSTFLVGADGRVKEVWRKVKVPGHAAAVLAALEAL